MIPKKWLSVAGAGVLALGLVACGDDSDEGGGGGGASGETKKITIGWTPPDITGVFKTATDYFERAAEDAKAAGFEVEIVSRSPATHTDFASQRSCSAGSGAAAIASSTNGVLVVPGQIETARMPSRA